MAAPPQLEGELAPTTDAPDGAAVSHGSQDRLWRLLPDPDVSGFADAGDGLPPLMRRLLARRGVHNTEEARRYLGSPGELTDPRLMPNLDIAVGRLADACRSGETVAVFGDFDVDGVTSTTILTEGLRELGAKPVPYIPDRFREGYGPNVNAVRQLADRGASLLVTADCGTSSVTEVDEANSLGMEVIVIDHHTVPERAPGRPRARQSEADRLPVRFRTGRRRRRLQGRPRPLRPLRPAVRR